MSHNNYSYTLFEVADFGLRETLGFTGGNFQRDNTHVIGDKGSEVRCEGCKEEIGKPNYFPETYLDRNNKTVPFGTNHPHYNHEEALVIVDLSEWKVAE